jgi:hypothetical protein
MVSSPLLRRISLVVAVGVVAVGSAVAVPALFSGGPEPIAEVPADNPALGMVYAGLSPAKRGNPCVGAYEVSEPGQCSHGPDVPPAGLVVDKWTPPLTQMASVPALANDGKVGPTESDITGDEHGITGDGGLAMLPEADGMIQFVASADGTVCDSDGVSGKRVQVMYVRAAGTTSRFAEYFESFRTWAAGVDAIYEASAKETGGSRHVRFVTTPDCKIDVQEVEVPAGGMDNFKTMIDALKTLGYSRTDRKYMIFGDSQVYCGIGTFSADDQPGPNNASNSGPSFGRSDSGCWASSVAAHELAHNLGAVNDSAPNSNKAGHCTDEFDIMCYDDPHGLKTKDVCANHAEDQRLDCNHDDYFNTLPSPGSYLAKHWNVADSQFLMNTGLNTASVPAPPASGSPSPSTPPSPSASPSPSKPPASPKPPAKSPSGSPTVILESLRTTDVGPTSLRLAWPAAPAGSTYTVLLNGQRLGQVNSSRIRLVGMNPDTDYRLSVSIDGRPYTNTVLAHTDKSADPVPERWFALGNGLSGGVADLFGARSEAGTPLVLHHLHQGANQLWKLEPAANGTFTIRSKATDKCVGFKGELDAEGTPIVEQACPDAPLWKFDRTDRGLALVSGEGLVMGVSRERYFGNRVLVLQDPTGARYQSWNLRTV